MTRISLRNSGHRRRLLVVVGVVVLCCLTLQLIFEVAHHVKHILLLLCGS